MTGRDLIKWIKDHKAEDFVVTVADGRRFNNGGWYLTTASMYTTHSRTGHELSIEPFVRYDSEDTDKPHNTIVL